MKRNLWIAGLLSVAVVGLAAEQASAWFFKNLCCKKHGTNICCRPYNAFTPSCFGSLYCDGCCPSGFGGGCFHGGGFGGGGFHGGGWHAGLPTPSYGPHSAMPPHAYPGYPYMYGPEPSQGPAPTFQPPPPTPTTTASFPHNHGVHAAGSPRGVYPNFWPHYPMGYWTPAYAPTPQGNWGVPYGQPYGQ